MENIESLRHVHLNFTDGVKTILYVLTLGALIKFVTTKWHVPGLSELVAYVI